MIQQAKRFNVVCCGRRWGKTVLGMDRLIHPALQGKRLAWFAPNFRLLADVWRNLQAILGPVIIRTCPAGMAIGVTRWWCGWPRAYAMDVRF